MKKLILLAATVGICLTALPLQAQACPHRHHGQVRAGHDHHGCPIYRYPHHNH